MNIRNSLENIAMTSPFWILGVVIGINVALSPKLKYDINIDGSNYRVFQDSIMTKVCAGNPVCPRDMIDNNNDGIVDEYFTGISAPRRGAFGSTLCGKDIPKKIQAEYDKVIAYTKGL